VASASRKFQNLLAQPRQPNHLLFMQQDSVSLQEIIRFIYLGKCVVSQSDFVKTYELLQMFQIEGGLTTEENDGHGEEELEEYLKKDPNEEKLFLKKHDLEQVKVQNEDNILLNEHDLELVNDESFMETDDKDRKTFIVEQTNVVVVEKKWDPVKYKCGKCDFISTNHVKLIDHMIEVHKDCEYSCDQCDFTIPLNSITTTGASQKMSSHKRFEHVGIRHTCDQCDFQTGHPYMLRKHKERWHEGKRYACKLCNVSFANKPNAEEHMKYNHSGVEFKCELCSFTAVRPKYLKEHMKRLHSK